MTALETAAQRRWPTSAAGKAQPRPRKSLTCIPFPFAFAILPRRVVVVPGRARNSKCLPRLGPRLVWLECARQSPVAVVSASGIAAVVDSTPTKPTTHQPRAVRFWAAMPPSHLAAPLRPCASAGQLNVETYDCPATLLASMPNPPCLKIARRARPAHWTITVVIHAKSHSL